MSTNTIETDCLSQWKSPAPDLVVMRQMNAPRRVVFEAWTVPRHLMQWLGPLDFTVPFCELDCRPNGSYQVCIRSSEGADYWMRGVYREFLEPERLVFTLASEPPNAPDRETLVTVDFAECEGKTEITLRQGGFASGDAANSPLPAWDESLDCLAAYAAKL